MNELRLQNIGGRGWELAPDVWTEERPDGSTLLRTADGTTWAFWWGVPVRTGRGIADELRGE